MTGKHSRARLPERAGRRRGRSASELTRAAAATRGSGRAGQAGTMAAAIFRREALEFRASGRDTESGVVRLGAPWINWCYWLMLALVCGGVATAGLARTPQYSYGRAVITGPGGRFAALLPAASLPDLATARDLSMVLPGRGLRPVRVTRLRAALARTSAVRRAGLSPTGQPSVLLTGQLADPGRTGIEHRAGRLVTQVALVLPSRSVAGLLAAEFEVMLGTREAGR